MDLVALNKAVEQESQFVQKVLSEVSKVIVGQKKMVEGLLMGLLTRGHVLLEGLPGLAKTLTISSMARVTSLQFHRVQFTPDLLPSDLIGTMVFQPKTGEFYPKKGPIFSHIVLADEINRAPAKVQSALLEAMAERQVTIGETSYPLDDPFLVLATQNPIEQEGTYSLPEAQMDRFMFKIIVEPPTRSEEMEILEKMSLHEQPQVQALLGREEILKAAQRVQSIYVDEKIQNYIVDLVMASRKPEDYGLRRIKSLLSVGGSPRASLSLIRASRAHAFIRGRGYVTSEDVKSVVYEVLSHRLLLTYEAEAEGMTARSLVQEIVSHIEVP